MACSYSVISTSPTSPSEHTIAASSAHIEGPHPVLLGQVLHPPMRALGHRVRERALDHMAADAVLGDLGAIVIVVAQQAVHRMCSAVRRCWRPHCRSMPAACRAARLQGGEGNAEAGAVTAPAQGQLFWPRVRSYSGITTVPSGNTMAPSPLASKKPTWWALASTCTRPCAFSATESANEA